MVDRPVPTRARLERLPAHTWVTIAVVALSLVYSVVAVALVRPYLWPAGTGARVSEDPAARSPLIARPPDVEALRGREPTIVALAPGGSAEGRGLTVRDVVVRAATVDASAELGALSATDPSMQLDAWRAAYWLGVRGPVVWTVRSPGGPPRQVALERVNGAVRAIPGWARAHLGTVVQIVVFASGALVLLLLRTEDRTANLCVLALALSAVGGGGPLLGAEGRSAVAKALTLFAWMASPLAFPIIALAILHFPTRSRLIVARPWLQALPFAIAMPMIGPGLLTGLYLAGVDGLRTAAVWEATHPGLYHASFAAALGVNLVAIVEGIYRFRYNHDANERRRIRMAVYTAVPGVIAYAIKDGIPIVLMLSGRTPPQYSAGLYAVLQILVLLPAFGLVYAVGVARVLGPRVVLRRSLQYALASRTLTVVAILPVIALAVSLARDRGRTIGDIATGSGGLYLALVVGLVAARRYREPARQWLDLRFFREEYDARKILLSLATRVRFETDPSDLAATVVTQVDAALHPDMVAVLASGLEDGRLVPVTVLHGSAESLPLDGGLSDMLRWSDEPLDILMSDPRSPVRRLPPEEQEWLHCTGASLLVPVLAQDRSLLAVIVLGERQSEEAYTEEDRQLLGSIAAQMGLGFDVARLRRRAVVPVELEQDTTQLLAPIPAAMVECAKCGRCADAGTVACTIDGSPMRSVTGIPLVIDQKYRVEQLLGRGGMGAVYRARDMRLDRLVAVKVVRAELLGDPDARLRFRREAQIVARLQHPSIVAVFDYGTFADGGAFLVMELVPGEDLRRVLQREGRLQPDRALRILTAVCAAIEAAHRQGVLHRDLKPENILLPGGAVDAKVLDFGVAKVIENDGAMVTQAESAPLMTAPGLIIGTPAYMAPEQFRAAQADARTDIFSLGVIAYEMLSGHLPFGRGTLADVVLAHTRGVPPMGDGAVPPEVEWAIRSALETDPDRRPASAQAFAHLIGSAMGL